MENSVENMQPNPEQSPLESARRHVENNLVAAVDGRECVDGRYDQHSLESGFIARPGGDFGYVMGLLALRREGKIQLSPQECVDAIYDFVTKDDGLFYMHSDDHAKHENTLSGCGHIANAANSEYSHDYGVDSQDVIDALEYAREITSHQKVSESELKGKHQEQAVLVVIGTTKTIDHHDENAMYFVYDKNRDEDFQKKIVLETNIEGLTYEDFNRVLTQQTNTTLGILAPNKEIIDVYVDRETPELKIVGIVPSLK